jgi:vacuolar-type H+-ATPase subunit E/Vma4
LDKKALDNIIKSIELDANRKIEEYRKIAEEKRQEILKNAREKLDKELRELRLRNEREIEIMANHIVSQAKISGRRRIIEEREKGINAVFSRALQKAPLDSRYIGYLEKSMRKAKEYLGSGTIVCRKSDEDSVRGMLPPGFDMKAELGEEDAGIIAYSSDGNRILDMRLNRIIEDIKDDLRKDVNDMLYGGNL